jgi:hypothetical protein
MEIRYKFKKRLSISKETQMKVLAENTYIADKEKTLNSILAVELIPGNKTISTKSEGM